MAKRRVFKIGSAVKSCKFEKIEDVEKWLSEDSNVCGVSLKWAVLGVVVSKISYIFSSYKTKEA